MRRLLLGILALLAVTPALAQVPQVSIATNIPTYGAGDVNIANIGAGDIFCIYGSATKTIAISRVHITATATSAIVVNEAVIKRSSVASGGTPVAETAVPLDSNNIAATATVTGYTVSPTPGTTVGTVVAHKLAIGVQGNTAAASEAAHDFGYLSDQPIILHGVAQGLCVNSSAAGAGASWAVNIRWTEF